MKQFIIACLCLGLFCGISWVNAELIDRGGYMIYDTDLDITWYDYSFTATNWYSIKNSVENLSVTYSVTGQTFDDWRLPNVVDGPYEHGFDGTTTAGYNITTSELGHLFYEELGNWGSKDKNGLFQAGYGLWQTGPFTRLLNQSYWNGTEYGLDTTQAWMTYLGNGGMDLEPKTYHGYGIAVRNGDVLEAIPEPSTWLLGLLGIAIIFLRK